MQVFSPDGITETLDTGQGGGRGHHVAIKLSEGQVHAENRIFGVDGTSGALRSSDYKDPPKIAIPVSTPDMTEKRQNGRRMKEDGEPMFTLTARDRHGVAVGVAVEESGESGEHPGLLVQIAEDCIVYAIWYEKYDSYIAIRKLTPLECFRLQGWEDEYFHRAQMVNSDSQLYKQAGNGVTVSVIAEIAKNFGYMESKSESDFAFGESGECKNGIND